MLGVKWKISLWKLLSSAIVQLTLGTSEEDVQSVVSERAEFGFWKNYPLPFSKVLLTRIPLDETKGILSLNCFPRVLIETLMGEIKSVIREESGLEYWEKSPEAIFDFFPNSFSI